MTEHYLETLAPAALQAVCGGEYRQAGPAIQCLLDYRKGAKDIDAKRDLGFNADDLGVRDEYNRVVAPLHAQNRTKFEVCLNPMTPENAP
jgi:hypothetical protein